MGLYAGSVPVVICYDYEVARELLSQDVTTGRPQSFVYKFRMLGDKHGRVQSDLLGCKYYNVSCQVDI